MSDQKAAGMLSSAIEKIKDLVDVSTIIGDTIVISDSISLIPISKVTYGFGAGGSDFPSKTNVELFGGGGGAGITITPVAFLVVNKGEVSIKYLSEGGESSVERAIGMVPDVVNKVSEVASKLMNKNKEEDAFDDFE